MGRPALEVGTFGTITNKWSEREQAYKARARYRDADGVVRPVARFGKTKHAAEQALKAALRDRRRTGGLGITGDMLVSELVDEWLNRIERSSRAIGTKQQYSKIAKSTVIPALGGFRVKEVRVSVCDAALQTINDRHGYSVAKTTRTVMAGIFGLAVRQDAIEANPVRDVEKLTPTVAKKAPRAFTVDQADNITDRLRTVQRAADLDLPDLVDFMLMTGCRIGEALACRTGAVNADGLPLVDFDAGTWEINATVIRILGVKRKQALEAKKDALTAEEQAELARMRKLPPGLYIQEHPKSEAGWRIIALPPAAVELLKRRRDQERLRPREIRLVDTNGRARTERPGVVFPSPAARALRDPNNAEGDLREVLDRIDCDHCSNTGYQVDEAGEFRLTDRSRRIRCTAGPWSWVTSHTFRKTVATRMEEAGCTPREVADQLGHSKVSMTTDVYFGRGVVCAAAARVLDR